MSLFSENQFSVKILGECLGTFLHVEVEIATGDECLKICKDTDGCNWFTHDQRSSTCLLMADCENLDETCKECVSGESRCPGEEPAWHMIFGGNGQSGNLKSVELFNWQTGEQCKLANPLPFTVAAHSGAVLDGVPVFCGGIAVLGQYPETSNLCYKLNKETMTWERVSPFIIIKGKTVSVSYLNALWCAMNYVNIYKAWLELNKNDINVFV